MNYKDSMYKFHRLVSHVQDELIRMELKRWAMTNIREYYVETSFQWEAKTQEADYMKHEKDRQLIQLAHGIVKEAHTTEEKFWESEILKGEGLKKLKIVRSTIAVIGGPQ